MKCIRISLILILAVVMIPGAQAEGVSRLRLSYDSGNIAAGVFGFGLAAQYSMTFNFGDTSMGHFLAVGYFAELEYLSYGGTSLFGAAAGIEFLAIWILNVQAGIGYMNYNGAGQFGVFLRGLLEVTLPLNILIHLGASIDLPTLGGVRVGIRAGVGYQF